VGQIPLGISKLKFDSGDEDEGGCRIEAPPAAPALAPVSLLLDMVTLFVPSKLTRKGRWLAELDQL